MQIDSRQTEELSYSDVPYGEVFSVFEQLFIKDNEGGGVNLVTGTRSHFEFDEQVLLIPGRFMVDIG